MLRQRIGHHAEPRQLLTHRVVKLLADAQLLAADTLQDFLFQAPLLRDILDGKQIVLAGGAVAVGHFARVNHQQAASDRGQRAFHLVVFNAALPGENLLQQRAQRSYFPLLVVEGKDRPVFDPPGSQPKSFIKCRIGRADAQITVEDDQRLPHGVHDVHRVLVGILELALWRLRASISMNARTAPSILLEALVYGRMMS